MVKVIFELNKWLDSIQLLKVVAVIDVYGKGEQINKNLKKKIRRILFSKPIHSLQLTFQGFHRVKNSGCIGGWYNNFVLNDAVLLLVNFGQGYYYY